MMENQLEKYFERLTEISREKRKKLEDILSITKAQSEEIEKDGIESLQKLLDDKQKKIEEIDKNDEDFDVYYKRIKQKYKIGSLENLNVSNVKEAKELQEVTGEIKKILEEICELEKQNSEKVKEALSSLSGEIRKINQGKKVSNVYSSDSAKNTASYFIDQKK